MYAWLEWWKIDPKELEGHVGAYDALPFWKSARGLSIVIILISVTVSIFLAYLHLIKPNEYVYGELAFLVILSFFIGKGHIWALILTGIIWTLDKAVAVLVAMKSYQVTGGAGVSPVVIILVYAFWWAVLMRPLFLAFQVEHQKRHPELRLINASKIGRIETVRALIDSGANLNAANFDRETALKAAARNGHLEVVEALIDNGADCDAPYTGATALILASENGHLGAVRALVDKGAKVDARKQGASDKPGKDNFEKYTGPTALFLASQNGHQGVVELLLNHGATVDARCGRDNATPLIIASQNGHCEVARTLIRKGADVNAKATNGVTPLAVAVSKQHPDVRDLLSESGAAA